MQIPRCLQTPTDFKGQQTPQIPIDAHTLLQTATDTYRLLQNLDSYISPNSYRYLKTFPVTCRLLQTFKDTTRHTDSKIQLQTLTNAYRQLQMPPNNHRCNQTYIDSYREPYILQIPMDSYRHLQAPIGIQRHPQTPTDTHRLL